MQRNAKLTLIALITVCVLPVVASYLLYFLWRPADTVNYGELLPPRALPDAVLADPAGSGTLDRSVLDGHWTLVYVGPADCDEACRQALYTMRQSRLAQGKEMGRIERLWLVSGEGAPAAEVVSAQDTLKVARVAPDWLSYFPAAERGVHLYLVDPLGNVMMRFPSEPDIKRVIKDLQRLLKYSGLGR